MLKHIVASFGGVNTLIITAACLVGVFAFSGMFKREDAGTRLRRECESIVRESRPNASPERRERMVRGCIEERGLAGK